MPWSAALDTSDRAAQRVTNTSVNANKNRSCLYNSVRFVAIWILFGIALRQEHAPIGGRWLPRQRLRAVCFRLARSWVGWSKWGLARVPSVKSSGARKHRNRTARPASWISEHRRQRIETDVQLSVSRAVLGSSPPLDAPGVSARPPAATPLETGSLSLAIATHSH
jgi:hypothetical protein